MFFKNIIKILNNINKYDAKSKIDRRTKGGDV